MNIASTTTIMASRGELATKAVTDDHATECAILYDLGQIIESELVYWAHYLKAVRSQTSFSAITTPDKPPRPESKVAALQYILDTLPLRTKALTMAYGISEGDNPIAEQLQLLLTNLKDEQTMMELEDWYDHKLFKAKRFRSEVIKLEDEILKLESSRMEDLKGLMSLVMDLKSLENMNCLTGEEIEVLQGVMDSVGLTAADENEFGSETRKAVVPMAPSLDTETICVAGRQKGTESESWSASGSTADGLQSDLCASTGPVTKEKRRDGSSEGSEYVP